MNVCVRYKVSHVVTARAAVTVIHPELGCLISCIELQKYSIILLYAEEGCSPGQQSTFSLNDTNKYTLFLTNTQRIMHHIFRCVSCTSLWMTMNVFTIIYGPQRIDYDDPLTFPLAPPAG